MGESDGVIAPTAAASETPQAPTWRLGRFAVASGLAVSVIVHLALVGTVLFVSPLFGRPAPVYSVPVELVTPEQVAAEKASTKPDQPELPKPEQPKPDQSAQSAQPDRQIQAPAQTAAALPLPPPALPLDAFSLPQPPGSREAASPPPPSGQAEQLAKLIGLPVVGAGGGPSDYKANLTQDQIAAFAAHVQSCWTAPAGVDDDPKLYVVIRVALRRDGGLAATPEVVAGTASMSALAIKQSAMRALQHCPAYADFPADKYDEWRLLDLRFTPSGISTAAPVSGAQRGSPRPG